MNEHSNLVTIAERAIARDLHYAFRRNGVVGLMDLIGELRTRNKALITKSLLLITIRTLNTDFSGSQLSSEYDDSVNYLERLIATLEANPT